MIDILINHIQKIDPELLYKEIDLNNNYIIWITKTKNINLKFKSIKKFMCDNNGDVYYYKIKINDLLLLIDVEELLNIV